MKTFCRHCKHWEGDAEYQFQRGECHRYPPQMRHDGEFRFPILPAGDHCGEYEWRG